MASKSNPPVKAYHDKEFLSGSDARELRILAEYMEPKSRFAEENVSDTIVFFGSARFLPRDQAEKNLQAAQSAGEPTAKAKQDLVMSQYYEDARTLAHRLTEWSKGLEDHRRRFMVCTGGGPGVMEASNRGASEAGGLNLGLNISLPHEQNNNPYISRELNFEFHYFFMRKFWFIYMAKAIIVFPGGFGTMDEFFEALTLIQTDKLGKKLPIVMYGKQFWDDVLNLDALVKHGTISADDLNLFLKTDSIDEAFDYITTELKTHALEKPGGSL